MKIFAFFLLIGLASASYDKTSEDAVRENALGVEHDALKADGEVSTELGRQLREDIERVLERVKEAVKEGKHLSKDMFDKLKELGQKLREIKGEMSERGKDLLQELKEQARDYFKKLLQKYGLDKRSLRSELNYKDILRKIKEHLKNNVDPELLKEKMEQLFDQGTEILRVLLQTLKEKGKRRLEMLIDFLLGDDDEDEEQQRDARAIKDYWEKVKNYFKDLKIDLQEKYMKFGEWVKTALDKGLEHSKDKMENIRAIAKEFAKHAKNASKEIGAEASEFFKQYKEELGNVWDELKEAFKQIKERKD